jgi:hypothetical protein
MSDTITEFDVGPEDEELVPVPLVQIYELDGGFFAATLSEAGDPEAPNLSGQVKTRHILAVDAASLEPQILACLVADFGMLQVDAALVPRVMLIEGEVITPEPEAPPEEIPPEEIPPEVPPEEPTVPPSGEIDNTLPEGQEPPVDPPMVQPTSWEEPRREA